MFKHLICVFCRSSDGEYLIVSSIDGFCTIVTIDVKLLGIPYRAVEFTTGPMEQAAIS